MSTLFDLLARYVTRGNPAQPRSAGQRIALLILTFLIFLLLYSVFALFAAGGVFVLFAFSNTETAFHVALSVMAIGLVAAVVGAIVQCVRIARLSTT
ncbi:MAG: hypothetical protein AB8G16_07020 [Gammaproteobacteria bacterium]